MNEKTTDENEMDVEQWLAIRKEAGLKIDPETAEVIWNYTQTLNPYGVCPDLPEEYSKLGGNISPAHLEAKYGSGLAICLT